MDTGSTGVALSAASLPSWKHLDPHKYQLGWEFLSSSKRLWVGRWIPENIISVEANVTAEVKILAITREIVCPDYNETNDGPHCLHKNRQVTCMPKNINYMGVGFGREYDGQTQGTPDKNPLLNIFTIGGTPISPESISAGCIVTESGVHVGLTADNTKGFQKTKLTPRTDSGDKRDWEGVSMCVKVDDSPCVNGSLLVDTGVSQMYLTVTPNI